jgi:hypothetical protein
MHRFCGNGAPNQRLNCPLPCFMHRFRGNGASNQSKDFVVTVLLCGNGVPSQLQAFGGNGAPKSLVHSGNGAPNQSKDFVVTVLRCGNGAPSW